MTITVNAANITKGSKMNRLIEPGNMPIIFIFAILMFLQWSPPGFYVWLASFRWYFMAGVAGFIFVLQSRYIKVSNTRFYLLFYFLSWGGIFLSLLRTYRPLETLYVAVSMVVPFSFGLVLIPIFNQVKGRVVWLGALGGASILWAYRIIQLWLTFGENIRYELVGHGADHNMIALCLACAATVFMIIALYGDFAVLQSLKNPIRFASFIASIGFLAVSFLTYSRSGFIITFLGIAFAVLTLVLSKRMPAFLIIVFFLLFSLSILIPVMQVTNPVWFYKFSELSLLGDSGTSVYVRVVLVEKALQIIKENPIIGIGPGSFKTIYDATMGRQSFYMSHNTYLGTWAEQGILGFAAYLILIFMWARTFMKNWSNFDISKKAIMSAFVPFFLMLAFLDMNGILNISFLAFFSSLNVEVENV
jgi:O-antigen ligase